MDSQIVGTRFRDFEPLSKFDTTDKAAGVVKLAAY